jgi:hypothetical protein
MGLLGPDEQSFLCRETDKHGEQCDCAGHVARWIDSVIELALKAQG